MKNLTRFLYVLALVPILAGGWTIVAGSESIPSAGDPNANLESELRFYSAWYVGAGLALMWLAPRVATHVREFRAFCGVLLLSGLSRIPAVLETDWPSAGQTTLMAIELTLPIVLVAWQARATPLRAAGPAER